MARPLRIQRPRGRYNVTARGDERKPIYRQEADRLHFLTLLSESTEQFGLQVHAYVLMDNHFHLMLQTPEDNLAALKQLAPAVSWQQIVGAVKQAKHEVWNDLAQRHRYWGRDAAMWLGRLQQDRPLRRQTAQIA